MGRVSVSAEHRLGGGACGTSAADLVGEVMNHLLGRPAVGSWTTVELSVVSAVRRCHHRTMVVRVSVPEISARLAVRRCRHIQS